MWKEKVVFNHRKLASITFLKVNRKEIHSVVCSCPSFHEYHPVRRARHDRACRRAAADWASIGIHNGGAWLTVTRFRTLIWVTSFWWMRCGEPLLIKLILGSIGCQQTPPAPRAPLHTTQMRRLGRRRRHATPVHPIVIVVRWKFSIFRLKCQGVIFNKKISLVIIISSSLHSGRRRMPRAAAYRCRRRRVSSCLTRFAHSGSIFRPLHRRRRCRRRCWTLL